MARRRSYKAPPSEQARAGDRKFAAMWSSLVTSPAFHDLSDHQARLYLCCVLETRGRASDDPDGGELYFYMNRHLYVEHYGIYGKGNEGGFRRDMAALIEHGFVDCARNGHATHNKSLYRLSSRWQLWGEKGFSMPESFMTEHMLNERAKKLESW